MDSRAAKLALARQKLKNHQEKKQVSTPKEETSDEIHESNTLCSMITVEADNTENEKVPADYISEDFSKPELKLDSNNLFNASESDVNVTEILISNKQNLELQVNALQSKLSQLENNFTLVVNNNNYCKQLINNLEYELQTVQHKYEKAADEISAKEATITEINKAKSVLCDENNNLQEQLEFTKSMLSTKEIENNSIHNQLVNLQNQLDATQLQLQQITNGSQGFALHPSKSNDPEQNPELLLQKISHLEHQLKSLQKERDSINAHYEHYVGELNEQLKSTMTRNHELSQQVHNLSVRENSLIEQISEMEIRIQNIRQQPLENVISHADEVKNDTEKNELQQKYENVQIQLQELSYKYENLQKVNSEMEAKLQELIQAKESECEHDNISISKLTADIASDKVAAQRATEQNKKLKTDLQELEQAFIKISRDKLELTEKVAAEKFLNRELTLKLAEIEEKAKDMHTKLFAKDEEMIRLQSGYRELEKIVENKSKQESLLETPCSNENGNSENAHHEKCTHSKEGHIHTDDDHIGKNNNETICLLENNDSMIGSSKIPKEDAMLKLQDRFLKIMDEVANLSDEKHRLEHIILQLQNETDTICEYVALYQQQRSLLKKRDEERSAQIKIFQTECDLLKSQLEELSGIIIRLTQDAELATFFQTEPRQSDLAKVMKLLTNLKTNTLIDPHKTSSELKNFYPCSCCSGNLMEV